MVGMPAETMEILGRLATDPRMKFVWQELTKKKRLRDQPTAEFFHLARSLSDVSGNDPLPPVAIQEQAMLRLFEKTFELAGQSIPAMTVADATKACERYAQRASEIRDDAQQQIREGRPSSYYDLLRVVRVYDGLVRRYEMMNAQGDQLVGRRSKPVIRHFLAELSHLTRDVFGDPLYGILARLGNVAFNQTDLTSARVREMLAPPRGKRKRR